MLIGLLIVNSLFVRNFFSSNELHIDAGVFNTLQFVMPILLIFIELWLYDMLIDSFRYQKDDSQNAKSPRENSDD